MGHLDAVLKLPPEAMMALTVWNHRTAPENTHAHELVYGAADVPHKFLKCNWIAIGGFVPRLKLTFPLIVTWPLQYGCRDEPKK